MRKLLVLAAAALLVVGVATTSNASVLGYHGTLIVDFQNLGPVPITATGIVTANGSLGGSHASTVAVQGGLFKATKTVPVTDPEVTATIPSVIVTGTLGTGTVGNISGAAANTALGLSPNTIPLNGLARICLGAGCNAGAGGGALKLVLNQGGVGVGVGGLETIGGGGNIRLSLENAPWTLKTRTVNSQTANGGFRTVMQHGYAHGPGSTTTTTLLNSGVLQLIAPTQIHSVGLPGNSQKIGIFNVLRLHFVPEPGMLLLLGSGVVGMALLGRRRLKK